MEYLSSYLLYELNHALCSFTATPRLQFHISDPRDKIVQNVNISSVSQSSGLSSKLNLTRQHDCKGMLNFQNRASDIKLLKFYINWDNGAYLEKCNFQRKLICLFWNRHWIFGVEMSLRVVSDPES